MSSKITKVLSAFLALMMVLTLLPVSVLAADAAVTVKTEQELADALKSGAAHIVLGADITQEKTIQITKAVDLDLGGHTITGPEVLVSEDPEKDTQYSVKVNAPGEEVTIRNGKFVSRNDTESDTCIGHMEGILTLTGLEIKMAMGVDVLSTLKLMEDCTITSRFYLEHDENGEEINISGYSVVVSDLDGKAGEVGTIRDCNLTGSVYSTGIGVYEQVFTDEYHERYPDVQFTEEELQWYEDTLEKLKACGRDMGHIASIENCTIAAIDDNCPAVSLYYAKLDQLKDCTIVSEGFENSAVWLAVHAEIGKVENCHINVESTGFGSGINLYGYNTHVGTITGTDVSVKSIDQSYVAAIVVDGNSSVDLIDDCAVTTDAPDGVLVDVANGSTLSLISNCALENKQVRRDEEGNESFLGGLRAYNNGIIEAASNCTVTKGALNLENGSFGRFSNITASHIQGLGDYYYEDPETGSTDFRPVAHNSVGALTRCHIQEGCDIVNTEIGSITDTTIEHHLALGESSVDFFARNTVKGPAGFDGDVGKMLDNTFEGGVELRVAADQISYNKFSEGDLVVFENATVKVLGPNTMREVGVRNFGSIETIADDGLIAADGSTFIAKDGWTIDGEGKLGKVQVPEKKTFTDVPEGIWYADGVDYVTTRELLTAEDTFSPEAIVNRDTIMSILAHLEGVETPAFGDGMAWAKAANISDGTNPEGNFTREQMAAVMYNIAGRPDVDEETLAKLDNFADKAEIGTWAMNAMAWAVAEGIISGTGAGLSPKLDMTRGQLVTLINNIYNG